MTLCSILASLILPIHEHKVSFLSVSSFIKLTVEPFTIMVKFILEHFYALVDGFAFLISFSDGLLLIHTTDFCMLIVVFFDFTESVLTIVCMSVCMYVYAFVLLLWWGIYHFLYIRSCNQQK